MTSLKIELVNETHTINIVEVVKKIFLRDVETDNFRRMIDHEIQGGIDNNLSLSDVTLSPESIPVTGNDVIGQVSGVGEDGYGLFALNGTTPTLCNINITLFHTYIKNVVRNVSTMTAAQRREMEGDPLVFIVIVLLFYSCGIAISMVIYMKKEQSECEEENLYKCYVEKARDRYNEFNNRGSTLNKLALQAVNTVNVVTLPNEEQKVTFV